VAICFELKARYHEWNFYNCSEQSALLKWAIGVGMFSILSDLTVKLSQMIEGGGVMASWLMRSPPDCVVRVRALVAVIVLCS